jgi:hypothetical protein
VFLEKNKICRNKHGRRVDLSRNLLVAVLPKTPTPQKDPVQEKETKKVIRFRRYVSKKHYLNVMIGQGNACSGGFFLLSGLKSCGRHDR